MKKAVCLLSGGMDSYVTAKIAKDSGFEIYALAFNYGQRHFKEMDCARKIAEKLEVSEFKSIDVNLQGIFKSTLTFSGEIPNANNSENTVPSTYVPARNTLFLSFALGYAESIKSNDIFIGISQVDYSGYPDCRQEFLNAFENLANLATCAGINGEKYKIHAPLINMPKWKEIILGLKMGVDFSLTWTCYKGKKRACGVCDSCKLRLEAFEKAGIIDPIEYEI